MATTFYLITLGCPKNQVDSERLGGVLSAAGWRAVDDPDEARWVLINTCGFIAPAVQESMEEIDAWIHWKQEAPGRHLAVGGCLVGRMAPVLYRTYPDVDVFFTLEQLEDLPALLSGKTHTGGLNRHPEEHRFPRWIPTGPFGYLKVAEGCDRACTFCTIPSFRGRQVSFPVDALLREAALLVKSGIRELNLVAQDLIRYGADQEDPDRLFRLLDGLHELEGLAWIRLFYLHPSGITPSFIQRLRTYPRVVPYLEIPIQHTEPHILRAMKRSGGARAVQRAMDTVRTYWPEAFLRTEVIVGFPGETEDDFHRMLDVLETYRPERVGWFPYYDEPGTPAHALPDRVPEEEKQIRLTLAREISQRWMQEAQSRLVGKTLEVLLEHPQRGRTPYDAPEVDFQVHVKGEGPVGQIRSVHIREIREDGDLVGEPLRETGTSA